MRQYLLCVSILAISVLHTTAIPEDVTADEVAVLRSGLLVKSNPRSRGYVDTVTKRVESFLDDAGIPYRRIDDVELVGDASGSALDRFSLAILPYNKLDAEAAATLVRFVGRGGKILAFYTIAAPEFYRLMGIEKGELQKPEFEGQFDFVDFDQEARKEWQGLPESIEQKSWNAFPITPLPGTQTLGWWQGGDKRTLPAVTCNDAGLYMGHILTGHDAPRKAAFLLSVVTALLPDLRERITEKAKQQTADKLRNLMDRWAEEKVSIGEGRRQSIGRKIEEVRKRFETAAGEPTPGTDATERLRMVRELREISEAAREITFSLMPSRDHEIRGVWFFRNSPTDWEKLMQQLADHGLNSIFVRVSRGGSAIYKSEIVPQMEWAVKAGGDELQKAIDAAHRHGIDFHAWRVNFHQGSAPKHFYNRLAAEDRLVRDPEGKQSYWTNPGDPRNLDLEYRAMMEIVENYDIDGIHFDYIRYPDAPHYNFDYGPVSRREFEKAAGLAVKLWPDDVMTGPLKLAYEDWERENINRLVKRVYNGVKQKKPHVRVSAAVWRRHRRYRTVIKQDWPHWIEQGWLDFVVPMDYDRRAATFTRTVDTQVAVVRGKIPLAAGIGNWLLGSQEEVLEFVKITRDHGADGFVLFSFNADRIEQHLAALKAGATSLAAKPAYDSPRFKFAICCAATSKLRDIPKAIIPRKDRPLAVEERQPLSVNIRLVRRPSRRKFKRITGKIRWEKLSESPIARLTRFDSNKGEEATVAAMAPSELFRPIVRGSVRFEDGSREDFVFRGPVLEGMTHEAIVELRQRERPPKLSGEGLHVGLYTDGLGAESLIEGLETVEGIAPFPLYRLRSDHLAVSKIMILPQLKDVSDLSQETVNALRDWVAEGGKLILTHDAVGFRWHPRMFPEVGQGIARIKEKTVVAVTEIPGIEKGWKFEHSFSDHIRLEAGDAGSVLVTEDGPDGSPVVIGGGMGKGIVVLCGLIPGYTSEEGLSDAERRLLAGLIRWMPGSESR